MRGLPELVVDLGAAGTLAAAGARTAGHGGAAAWAVAVVQWAVALAFVLRERERRAAGWRTVLAAVPSLAGAGAIFAAGREEPWSMPATALVLAGGGLTLGGLVSLGRSFAILPGVRHLRTGGLYRVVRHPVYLGELAMLAGASSRLGPRGAALFVAVLAAVIVRIRAEEALWAAEAEWSSWAARVRWRLVPGVW